MLACVCSAAVNGDHLISILILILTSTVCEFFLLKCVIYRRQFWNFYVIIATRINYNLFTMTERIMYIFDFHGRSTNASNGSFEKIS